MGSLMSMTMKARSGVDTSFQSRGAPKNVRGS